MFDRQTPLLARMLNATTVNHMSRLRQCVGTCVWCSGLAAHHHIQSDSAYNNKNDSCACQQRACFEGGFRGGKGNCRECFGDSSRCYYHLHSCVRKTDTIHVIVLQWLQLLTTDPNTF